MVCIEFDVIDRMGYYKKLRPILGGESLYLRGQQDPIEIHRLGNGQVFTYDGNIVRVLGARRREVLSTVSGLERRSGIKIIPREQR